MGETEKNTWEWLEADRWQDAKVTEFVISESGDPHNDICAVFFQEGATVSTIREEAAAYARLIAAAPDLVETLELALELRTLVAESLTSSYVYQPSARAADREADAIEKEIRAVLAQAKEQGE